MTILALELDKFKPIACKRGRVQYDSGRPRSEGLMLRSLFRLAEERT